MSHLIKEAQMNYSVYGVEVADANEHHYVQKIADLLYGISDFGSKGKKDLEVWGHHNCASIALKAVREAKKL